MSSDRAAAVAKSAGSEERKRTLVVRGVEEFRRLVAMFLYLWVVFGVVVIAELIGLAQHELNYTFYGFAALNALILAKVMLIAEDLDVARGFEEKPLIYPIVYKSIVFSIVFLCFHALERILVGVWHGQTIAESVPAIGGGGAKGLFLVEIVATVLLIPFFAFREIGRALGKEELHAMLFTRGRTKARAASFK